MIGETVLDLLAPASALRVDRLRCLHRRFARSRCRRCADACPQDALTVADGVHIDASRCHGCRLCEATCPAGALCGDERELTQLAGVLAEHPQPVLGCRRDGVVAHGRSGCLGFLEEEGLLALALLFPAGVTLNLSRCAGCDKSATVDRLAAALGAIRALPGMAETVSLRLATTEPVLAGEGVDLSRRAFFTFLGRRSQETAVKVVAQQFQSEPTLRQKFLPARRRLLLQGLKRLPPAARDVLEAQIFPSHVFTSSCTACTGCVGICPTGALTVSEDEPLRPVFDPRLCTGCGSCSEFCRKAGVTVTGPSFAGLKDEARPTVVEHAAGKETLPG